jgi:hypothetical protein
MSVFDRTPEQAKALHQIQQSFTPEIVAYLDELAEKMKNTPPEDIDREVNNVGVILRAIIEKESPQLSEPMQWGLPFAAIELLRTKLKAN